MRFFARICVLLAVLCHAGLAMAQYERQINATLQTGPIFPPGRWVPVTFNLRNDAVTPVAGSLSTDVQTPAGTYQLVRKINVPGRSTVRTSMLASFQAPETRAKPSDKALPIATFFWLGDDGTIVGREPIFAIADTGNIANKSEATGLPGVLVVQIFSSTPEGDLDDAFELTSALQVNSTYAFSMCSVAPERVMRRDIAFDACRLVIVDQEGLEQLDPAQREALLAHVNGGATLLVVAKDMGVGGSWIGPLLPMDIVGARESATLETSQFGNLKLRRVAPFNVCIARDGATVVASNAENTLAAYRDVGFGRIAMAAFPVSAIDPADAGNSPLWTQLIGTQRSAFHDPVALADSPEQASSRTDESLVGVLPSMVGATAPPWKTAAIISGIYTGLVALVLLVVGPARRPVAIVACVGCGILLAGGVIGLTALQSSDQPLMLARLGVVDLSGDTAKKREIITFFGQQRDNISFTLADNALPRAMLASGAAPKVGMFPFHVDGVASSTGNYASVWEIRSQSTGNEPLRASVAFGPEGAQLNVDSSRTNELLSPRLLSGGSVFPLSTLPTGKQSIPIAARNPSGDWSSADTLIAGEESKLRTEILTRVEAHRDPIQGLLRRSMDYKLVGFAGAGEPTGLTTTDAVDIRGQTLVRADVTLEPPAVGTVVRFDPGFTQIRRDFAVSLPYRPEGDTWSEASQGGPWLFAIAPPGGVAKIDPKQLILDLDVRATGYLFTLQRAQCAGGKVRENPAGETVLEWDNATGPKRAVIDLTPSDIDANGWVWIRMTAMPADRSGSLMAGFSEQALSNWRLMRFDATLSGNVTGPPQPTITTWHIEPPPKPTPKPAEPKKADSKKPNAKTPDPKKPEPKKPEPEE